INRSRTCAKPGSTAGHGNFSKMLIDLGYIKNWPATPHLLDERLSLLHLPGDVRVHAMESWAIGRACRCAGPAKLLDEDLVERRLRSWAAQRALPARHIAPKCQLWVISGHAACPDFSGGRGEKVGSYPDAGSSTHPIKFLTYGPVRGVIKF